MRIDHGRAIELEYIVRSVFSCERGSMGGYIDADHFESSPFDAALIAFAPLWEKADRHELSEFLYKWERVLRYEEDKNADLDSYIKELDGYVANLLKC